MVEIGAEGIDAIREASWTSRCGMGCAPASCVECDLETMIAEVTRLTAERDEARAEVAGTLRTATKTLVALEAERAKVERLRMTILTCSRCAHALKETEPGE